MNPKKIIEKLEHELSHFLINEITKSNPEKRGSSDVYKYKGLDLIADPKSKAKEKTVSIRIGPLEAEFKINDGTKQSGALSPEDERLVMLWLGMSENNYHLKAIFAHDEVRFVPNIIPFDLEEFYANPY